MAEKKENAFVKYFKGVKSELKKVTWPSFKQVIKNTWTVMRDQRTISSICIPFNFESFLSFV